MSLLLGVIVSLEQCSCLQGFTQIILETNKTQTHNMELKNIKQTALIQTVDME